MTESAVGNWDEISGWWSTEVVADPVYREDVGPVFNTLCAGETAPLLDLGCGEGQWLRTLPERVTAFGTDGSLTLLRDARHAAPVVQATLPSLSWVRSDTIGTAFSLFVLDLIDDYERFFTETARAVRRGGALVVVINHPAFTAPGSGPFMDPDLDVFWRWGRYLENGESDVPAGPEVVTMYHRPTATLLTAAAEAGWALEEMIEAPLGAAAIEREPSYAGQESIPRFLGVRWRRRLKDLPPGADDMRDVGHGGS